MLRQLMEIMLQFFFVTPARRKSGLTKRRSREEGETQPVMLPLVLLVLAV